MIVGWYARRFLAACVLVLASISALAQNPRSGTDAVVVAPSSLTFANQAIGSTSPAQNVILTNNQTTPLTITGITIDLSDFTETTTCPANPKKLAAGASCTISVSFTPSVTGIRSGSLVVFTDASVTPMVSLSGTGVLAVVVNPSALTFGTQKVGTAGAAQTVTLTNNQSTALTITSISSTLSDFQVTTTCPMKPRTLAAGTSCTVSISFWPSVTGTRSGTLNFVDSANNSPQQVTMIGTGASGTLASIAVTPATASVALGLTQQFTATGTFSDHSTQ